MCNSDIKWPDGFISGTSRTRLPSKEDSKRMLDSHKLMPYPLNLHINSIFQFYFFPLRCLIDLNNSDVKSKAIPTIWFSGYREMQAIFPIDFKFWCFSGKKGRYSILRILVLLRLYFRFFSYIRLIFLKGARSSSVEMNKFLFKDLLLIRRPIHLSSYANPFYKGIAKNTTKVLFFYPKRGLSKDEVYAPLSFKMLFKALWNCTFSIYRAFKTNCKIQVSDIELDLKAANIEACCHFETFLYKEQLQAIASLKNNNKILSFEQVSSSAELEKKFFSKNDLFHIQFGIVPYYPYPTIGVGSTFVIRSSNVFKSYSDNLIDRSFEKLKVDKDLFCNIQYQLQKPPCYVFATQPYRKKQEGELLQTLSKAGIGRNIWIKYHPRELELYSNFSTVENLFSMENILVITRTSSLVVELFARGIPYACYIDDKDLDLDQGEVSKIDDPVTFANLDELIVSIKNINDYIDSFKEWRNVKLKDYLGD
mgnify:FL=1|jgi:hypothetical protein